MYKFRKNWVKLGMATAGSGRAELTLPFPVKKADRPMSKTTVLDKCPSTGYKAAKSPQKKKLQ